MAGITQKNLCSFISVVVVFPFHNSRSNWQLAVTFKVVILIIIFIINIHHHHHNNNNDLTLEDAEKEVIYLVDMACLIEPKKAAKRDGKIQKY